LPIDRLLLLNFVRKNGNCCPIPRYLCIQWVKGSRDANLEACSQQQEKCKSVQEMPDKMGADIAARTASRNAALLAALHGSASASLLPR